MKEAREYHCERFQSQAAQEHKTKWKGVFAQLLKATQPLTSVEYPVSGKLDVWFETVANHLEEVYVYRIKSQKLGRWVCTWHRQGVPKNVNVLKCKKSHVKCSVDLNRKRNDPSAFWTF